MRTIFANYACLLTYLFIKVFYIVFISSYLMNTAKKLNNDYMFEATM